ncbi:MAG TPA: hypothetical protein PK765_00015 [bacterium]|nr:hypothetical protein [bacterium]
MSLLTLPIGDILESFPGDTREYRFEGEIPSGYYDDLEFSAPLVLVIRIIGLDDGVQVIIETLKTSIVTPDGDRAISLSGLDREFKKLYDPLAPDDVKTIDMKHRTVDLSEVVREEILITCM